MSLSLGASRKRPWGAKRAARFQNIARGPRLLRNVAAGNKNAANSKLLREKKQGATGITTVAPYVTGQWGRGNNRLPE
jgi:hypothetical protein